jgi:Xaa-Pro aminopeptidase
MSSTTKEAAAAPSEAPGAGPSLTTHLHAGMPLVNRGRAEAVMDKYHLTALVATTPLNIYYLSSHRGPSQWMGKAFSTYAVLPRHLDAEPTLILPGTTVYHPDYRPTWMPRVEVYTYPATATVQSKDALVDRDDPVRAEPKVAPWAGRVRPGELHRADRVLMAIYAQHEGRTHASALLALKSALRHAGVHKDRVGFDDPRPGEWLARDGLPGLIPVDADNIFREVRMVKTRPEIELLREAASRNELALDYAISTIRPGTTLDEIEHAHGRRWATLDGKSRWCITNIRGLASGVVEAGDFMKLDSVGEFRGYLGDVGRTVSCGAPSEELAGRIAANGVALQQTYAEIRPGMSFARSGALFRESMRAQGFDAVGAPHAVGLEHTDQPWPKGIEPPGAIDSLLVFEEGTVFTLDAPYHEIGWGTTHVEDMMVVRRNGAEPLSSMDTSLRIRPV